MIADAAGADDDMGWSPRSATVTPSQVALAIPVRTEELTHANIGGQPSHTFYAATRRLRDVRSFARSRFVAPVAKYARNSKSSDTLGSAASIFATRD
jgi:hypothetical protein